MKYKESGRVVSQIKRRPAQKGESIEEMVRRCTESKEPIEAIAPMIYTEKADGVQPQYNIRADRFDIALDAVDKYQKSQIAKQKKTEEETKGEEAKVTEPKKE